MSRRLAELLAAANLAKLQDDQAAREGAASAANTGQWINALQSLVPAATGALDKYQGSVAKDADTAAAQEIANHAADVGDDVDTPSAIASGAVAGNDKLTPKKPTGLLDSLSSILGNRESAAATAKAKATAGITGEVMANRSTAEQKSAAREDKANAGEAAIRAREAAQLDASEAAQRAREQAVELEQMKEDAAAKLEGMKETAKAGAKGKGDGGPDLKKEKLQLEVDALKANATKKDDGQQVPATVAQRWGNMQGTAATARKLADDVKPEDFTVENRAMSLLPLQMRGDRQKELNRKIDRFVQRAGVGLEGGKLAEGDITRYRQMLVSAADDYDTFQTVAKQIAAEIDQQVADEKGGLSTNGFAVDRPSTSGSSAVKRGTETPAAADPLAGSAGW